MRAPAPGRAGGGAQPLRPATAEELAEALRGRRPDAPPPVLTGAPALDREAGEAIAALGPDRLLLSTAGLGGIVEHRPRDLTVSARAGLRAGELLAFLEEREQWLPLEGEALDRSIGGLIAAAPHGPFDASFGPVRRHLLECRVAAPDGSLLRWGRPVMKNVAGYDLPRLLCGSRGRLGAIVEATFRVWPRPVVRRSHALAGGPGALELASRLAAAAPSDPVPDGAAWHWTEGEEPDEGSLRLTLAGGAAGVAARERALLRWARQAGAELEHPATSAPAPARRARPLSRSAFHLAVGRRYVGDLVRALQGLPGARIVQMEVLPLSGVLRFEAERPAWPRLRRALEAFPDARATVERGSPEELAEAEGRRPVPVRALEARVSAALGGSPRQWLADYL